MTEYSKKFPRSVFLFLKPWLEALLQAVAMAAVLFIVLWPVQVDGLSMESTLSNKDRLLMSRIYIVLAPVERGDLVVCKSYATKEYIVKRVIAVPGDSISIRDGSVVVNGEALDESEYIGDKKTSGNLSATLGDDEYFLMGDNREISLDSRDLGALKKSEITGKVIIRFYPFTSIRLF